MDPNPNQLPGQRPVSAVDRLREELLETYHDDPHMVDSHLDDLAAENPELFR